MEQSPVKKLESALDDLHDLWHRRKIVCCIVLAVIVLPISFTSYQQLVAVPRLKNQITSLDAEKGKVEKERDKAELKLAPFLAAAERSFPNTPSEKSLDLLLERIDKAITEAFRYDLPPEKMEGSAALFAAVKFLLDDIDKPPYDLKWHCHRLVVSATKGLSTSVIPLLRSRSFKDFLISAGVNIEVMSFAERQKRMPPLPHTGLVLANSHKGNAAPDNHYVLFPNLDLSIGKEMLRDMERVHFDFRRLYTEIVRDAVNANRSNK
jgi:hypothetical protein